MKIDKLLIALALTVSGSALAQEHPACSKLDYHLEPYDSTLLRAIAASCKSESIANLYYNRAYHADLVIEGTTLAELDVYSREGNVAHFDRYRLYMALLEQMAPIWYEDSAERASLLNREYDRSNEVARLRLRGYDHAADKLEHKTVSR